MSAPDTNIETQQKRHFVPLWGIALMVLFVGIGIVAIPTTTDEISEEPSIIIIDPVEASQ